MIRRLTFYTGPEPEEVGKALVLEDGEVVSKGRVAAILKDMRVPTASQDQVVKYILRRATAYPYAWANEDD